MDPSSVIERRLVAQRDPWDERQLGRSGVNASRQKRISSKRKGLLKQLRWNLTAHLGWPYIILFEGAKEQKDWEKGNVALNGNCDTLMGRMRGRWEREQVIFSSNYALV